MALIGVVYTTGITLLWVKLFHIGTIPGVVVAAIGTGLLFIYGIWSGKEGSIRRPFFYSVGLPVHAISVFLTHRAPMLIPFGAFALALAFIYVLAGLPLANRRFLVRETQEKKQCAYYSRHGAEGKQDLLAMVLAGIILLSFWDAFLNALGLCSGKIAELIGKILIVAVQTAGKRRRSTRGPKRRDGAVA